MRRLLALLVLVLVSILGAGTARAEHESLVRASGASPFAPGCNGAPQTGTLLRNAEVEPWVDSNPAEPRNLVAVWQQDRWSNGGAQGTLTAYSFNRGRSWARPAPPTFSRCAGGTPVNGGDYERASDPWVSIGPDGTAHQIALAINDSDPTSAILVSASRDGGRSWGAVTTLQKDTTAELFNDKESITADSTDSRYVYAVWDRLQTAEPDNPASAFSGDTLFARSTDVLFAATHGRSAYSIRLESRPTVAISGPSELRVGEPVTYGASGQAYDGGAVRLAWQLPGTPSTGAGTSVSFTPVAPGQTTVRVTATDANGLAGTAERAVTISPAQAVPTPGSQGRDTSKPTLRVRKVKQVRRPKRSAIRGRATDASGIARVTVRFGDGKRKRVRPSRTGRFTVKHRYGTVASYEATVTAVDEAGNARTKHAKVRVRKRRTGRA